MPDTLSENYSKLEHIDIEITRNCNLDCIHCSADRKRRGTELSIYEIKRILREAKELGLSKLGFTGGEPFLRYEGLKELVNFSINELDTKIHIHSNGIPISSEIAKWIKNLDIDMTVTLFGSTAKTHDTITDKKGSMKATLKGLQNLLDEKASVSTFIVPMKLNVHEIIPLIRIVNQMGCKDIRILSLSPTGKAMKKYSELALTQDKIDQLNKKFIEIQEELDIYLNAGFCTRLSHPVLKVRKGHDICYSAENRVHIDAFGNVFPCTASSGRMIFSAGKILMHENTLSDIWLHSPLFQFIRKFHTIRPDKCQHCKNYNDCMGGCRVMMSYKYGDFTIANPDCGGPH